MGTAGCLVGWVFLTVVFLSLNKGGDAAVADIGDEIMAAERQCKAQMSVSSPPNHNGTYCPQEWDGAFCWPYGTPGVRVSAPCPAFFRSRGHAYRHCERSGKWRINRATNKTFLNHTECTEIPNDEPLIPRHVIDNVTNIYTIGYSISLVSLFIAFIILARFKRLHCTRNYVHMHLFVSYMLRAFFILLRDAVLYSQDTNNSTTVPRNTVGCKLLYTCFMYFMATNYFWILVEGLYLHNLIFVSVFSERKFFYGFIAIGWVFPLTFVVPWVVVRATMEDTGCWDTDTVYKWIYKAPIVLSIVVNFLLFLNILRVLVKKLRMPADVANQNRRKCCSCCFRRPALQDSGADNHYGGRRNSVQLQMPMKLAKSTMVLIPLFGVHYIVFVGMPDDTKGLAQEIRLYFELFFSSFQGFFVSILYCFLNGEVRAEFKRKWERWKLARNFNSRGGNMSRSPLSHTAVTSMDYSHSPSVNSIRNGTPPSSHSLPRNGSPWNGRLNHHKEDCLRVPDIAMQKLASFSDDVSSHIDEERDKCSENAALVRKTSSTASEMESNV
ncbi:secretin receptor-like [Branchiostoma lanceolatum]|uniref:secretin receptor-like n=1 Tax=Branchiostoma lanceolatum TaxID=7740 RepID=UPI00345688FD